MSAGCLRLEAGAVIVFVRLTPKSSRDALEGAGSSDDGRQWLKARVRAVPEDGKANAALEKLIAKTAGVAKSDVAVTAGQTSRLKTVRIACTPDRRDAIVARLLGKSG